MLLTLLIKIAQMMDRINSKYVIVNKVLKITQIVDIVSVIYPIMKFNQNEQVFLFTFCQAYCLGCVNSAENSQSSLV